MGIKGRFAPSPSGRMHLGNVYAALMSYLSAKKQGGAWLLRIEDLDRQRCKKEYAEALIDDLAWLGLFPDEGARTLSDDRYFQSNRTAFYEEAFSRLQEKGLTYPCFCRRADLLSASAPHASDGTPVYSGRCRSLTKAQKEEFSRTRTPATRLCITSDDASRMSHFTDGHFGEQSADLARDCGDFIIRRADGNFAYQLAVTVDDALMQVTEVVRGRDLLSSTHQQLCLYHALEYTPPAFSHIPLLVSSDGKRLSKRDRDTDMGYLREHYTPQALIGHIMHLCGFTEREEALSLAEAVSAFSWPRLPTADIPAE